MIRTLSRYFLLVVSVAMLSCGDDDDKVSRTDLLTAHAWVVKQYEIGGQVSDVIECSADDVNTFFKDGKYSYTTGSVKCDDDEADVSGTWLLKENDQILSITIDGVTDEGTVVTLTSNTLKLKTKGVLLEDGEIVGEYEMYLIYSPK